MSSHVCRWLAAYLHSFTCKVVAAGAHAATCKHLPLNRRLPRASTVASITHQRPPPSASPWAVSVIDFVMDSTSQKQTVILDYELESAKHDKGSIKSIVDLLIAVYVDLLIADLLCIVDLLIVVVCGPADCGCGVVVLSCCKCNVVV
ncbi:hypothetical protein ZIOFF_075611 [Zingiber officinale]|uniref:Uncharacterized protein n=1 Tax=Zingiber officinale TaxID=94328 RepID=A0A8J5B8V5_ZINOF|nr:hypothetical protein ZIOFF_075611 [Zingiber officinale]